MSDTFVFLVKFFYGNSEDAFMSGSGILQKKLIVHAQDVKKEVGRASPGMRICRLGLCKIVKSFGLCHIKRRN